MELETRRYVSAKFERKDGDKYVRDERVGSPRLKVIPTKDGKTNIISVGIQVMEDIKAGTWLNGAVYVPK